MNPKSTLSVAVVGCGRQAAALVYDLSRFGKEWIQEFVLADRDLAQIKKLITRVETALRQDGLKAPRFISRKIDASDAKGLNQALRNCGLVISCSHYALNPLIARIAVNRKVHYADLGGYLESTLEIKKLQPLARKNGVFLAPDLGLAPGMANILAGWGLQKMQPGVDLAIYCGGLPEKPIGPLGYKIVFAVEGLWGTHFGRTIILRDGQVKEVPTLTELEPLNFSPLGTLEAFITSGALATAPWSLRGKVRNYVYKTLRYPGYAQKMRWLESLGLTDPKPFKVGANFVVPRELLGKLMMEKLAFPDVRDLVALRVIVQGRLKESGQPQHITFEALEYADPHLGFSAMERATGYPAAIAIQMLLRQRPLGFIVLEEALRAELFIQELAKRNITVRKKVKVTPKQRNEASVSG